MLNGWHLLPWTIQYILAALIITSVSVDVLRRSPKSWTSRYFFIFGLLIACWQIMVFLSKNAPDEVLSGYFYGMVVFTSLLGTGFLLASMMNIPKERWYYGLITLPVLPFAVAGIYIRPFFMTWNEVYGWAYTFTGNFMLMIMLIALSHTVAMVVVSVFILRKYPGLKRKIYTILLGWVVVNVGGTILTNIMLNLDPSLPPFGGLINFISFMVIAYAIRMPVGEIKADTPSTLNKVFLEFTASLYNSIPGKELGERMVRFQRYIEALGLKDVVSMKDRDMFIVEVGDLTHDELKEIMDTVLRGLRHIDIEEDIARNTARLINVIHRELKSTDPDDAEGWLDDLVFDHGSYLYSYGVLDIFYDKGVPVVISKYTAGRSYLIGSSRPLVKYRELSKMVGWGYELLVITKYPKQKISIKEGERAEINSIFTEGYEVIKPEDLIDMVKDFSVEHRQRVVVIDCLDTLLMSWGAEYTCGVLKEINKRVERKNNILIALINDDLVDEDMIDAVKSLFSERGDI